MLLKHHRACVATFLSKDVTHIIRNQKQAAVIVDNSKVLKKMRNTRAEGMVQLSLKTNATIEKKNSCVTTETAIILSPNSLTKFSKQCRVCDRRPTKIARTNAKTAIVRPLRGQFIKVEDEHGIYKPLIIEMKEWPKLYLHGDISQSPFCNTEAKTTHANRFLKVKQQFCELCNDYFYDTKCHLNGSQHQSNARDDTLFDSLDKLIATGLSNVCKSN